MNLNRWAEACSVDGVWTACVLAWSSTVSIQQRLTDTGGIKSLLVKWHNSWNNSGHEKNLLLLFVNHQTVFFVQTTGFLPPPSLLLEEHPTRPQRPLMVLIPSPNPAREWSVFTPQGKAEAWHLTFLLHRRTWQGAALLLRQESGSQRSQSSLGDPFHHRTPSSGCHGDSLPHTVLCKEAGGISGSPVLCAPHGCSVTCSSSSVGKTDHVSFTKEVWLTLFLDQALTLWNTFKAICFYLFILKGLWIILRIKQRKGRVGMTEKTDPVCSLKEFAEVGRPSERYLCFLPFTILRLDSASLTNRQIL